MMEKELKSYAAPWKGKLVLACKKCQKKLKKSDHLQSLASLKKAIKARNKQNPENMLHVLSVPCMDLCPKDAVVACLPSREPDRVCLLRSEEDINRLYE